MAKAINQIEPAQWPFSFFYPKPRCVCYVWDACCANQDMSLVYGAFSLPVPTRGC